MGGRISTEIDKSCPHCSLQSVESVDHRFHNCPLAPHVWRYAANFIWQLFANKRNVGPQKSFSMLQCLFDQPLSITLRRFSRIWFFLRSGLPWIIWRQRNDGIFNKVHNPLRKHVKSFGTPSKIMVGLSGNGRLMIWKRPRMWLTKTFSRSSTLHGGSATLL